VAQIEVAIERKLPIVFHVRDAWEDFFTIISNFKFQNKNYPNGVIHCYTGDEKIVKKLIALGFYIGFTGFVTFEQSKFDHIREAAKVVPLDKLLIETDAPFLAPEPYRGKTNEPAFVLEVAKKNRQYKRN
jgi:TatD DNase family protein